MSREEQRSTRSCHSSSRGDAEFCICAAQHIRNCSTRCLRALFPRAFWISDAGRRPRWCQTDTSICPLQCRACSSNQEAEVFGVSVTERAPMGLEPRLRALPLSAELLIPGLAPLPTSSEGGVHGAQMGIHCVSGGPESSPLGLGQGWGTYRRRRIMMASHSAGVTPRSHEPQRVSQRPSCLVLPRHCGRNNRGKACGREGLEDVSDAKACSSCRGS